MSKKKLTAIADVSSLKDLKELKLRKKYEKQLHTLELKANIIQVQRELNPEVLKETLVQEGQNALQGLLLKFTPSFLMKFFK